MLNEYQKQVVRVAVGKALDKGAEIRKLSQGMKVPEDEIRAVLGDGKAPAPASRIPMPPLPPEPDPKAAPGSKPRGSRTNWTPEMVDRLTELHNQGMGPMAIADEMGLRVRPVALKLGRLKKQPPYASPKDRPDPEPAKPTPVTPPPVHPYAKFLKPREVDMAKELLGLMSHFETVYSAKPVLLQAAPTAGWATCSFEVGGRRYFVSLRERRKSDETSDA
ncbi:MAG: hypothetical protein LKJ21_07140 [Oscillospiraceae bacterium]|jgi:hypothetical protein|nr:hypothetical protein [Oscillospiraceae bacterium]MCI1990034.1 hypothetical protein [Oscillospiraceae bacterium]MCI2034794.1 hypothetical protein [Oscillospiraceae bacterium]